MCSEAKPTDDRQGERWWCRGCRCRCSGSCVVAHTFLFPPLASRLYPASCTCMTSAAKCKIKAGVSLQFCRLERNRNYIASYPRVCCLMFSERGKKAPQAVRQTAKLRWDIFWCSEVVRTAQRHLNLKECSSIPVWRIVLFLSTLQFTLTVARVPHSAVCKER